MQLALSIPNLAEPDELVELGEAAERSGWDGLFLWDHLHGSVDEPVPTADPWVVLGALAVRTTRLRLGTSITAVPRRQPQKLARETVTVDRLSGGRMVLGVGLGEPPEEHTAYGGTADRAVLASMLDEGLEVVAGLWSGEPFDHRGRHFTVERACYRPTPVQSPRIPVWASCVLPHRRPLERAARWDGVLLAAIGPTGTIDPVGADDLRSVVEEVGRRRTDDAPFDVAVSHPGLPDGDALAELADAGATWVLATGWLGDAGELAELARRGPVSRG